MAVQNNLSGVPSLSRTRAQPIPVPQSSRRHDVRAITSFMPGKMVPIAAIPLLREDRIRMSRFRLSFEMMETAEILMNAVNVNVKAYLVPNLAFERFDGLDALNRSYMKEPEKTGGSTVIPFIQTMVMPAHGASQILTAMGKHAKPGTVVNSAYVEAYNTIWNFRAANRSPDISPRSLTDQTLAKAFWQHQGWAAVVPDFDQATIDGEVPLNIVNGSLALNPRYASVVGGGADPTIQPSVGGADRTMYMGTSNQLKYSGATQGTDTPMKWGTKTGMVADMSTIFAELEENGITVSLSNIELARKTQAFAALRRQYNGLNDDYIIDLLMNGVTVPEQAWRQPILLSDRSTIFGMSKRYASDSLDLTASVANGATFIDLSITTPVCPTGGVVMIIAEVTPEQLFERQQDPYFHIVDQEKYPEFMRDTLDPEKVQIVQNQFVDVDHDTPTAVFGYAPLNWHWNHAGPSIGGKFFRPEVDAPTDEDRMRFWAVETQNPTLSEDFYLCTNMHTKPFVVTDQDPFEVVMKGTASIVGNTVFGRMLLEASDDYNTVMEEAPLDRIDKPETVEAPSMETPEEPVE